MNKSTRFTIEIELVNDAFAEDAAGEIGRILNDVGWLVQALSARAAHWAPAPGARFAILDINGNHVGSAKFS